jgi:hypothetical protein
VQDPTVKRHGPTNRDLAYYAELLGPQIYFKTTPGASSRDVSAVLPLVAQERHRIASEHGTNPLRSGRQIAIADPRPHIVALQECWTQEDYENIRRETRFILPYGKFYFSGAFGGGLAILSKWPIEESTMFKYPLNGRPTAFYHGDWYVGKGAACAKIRYGPGAKHVIEVFNTHVSESPADRLQRLKSEVRLMPMPMLMSTLTKICRPMHLMKAAQTTATSVSGMPRPGRYPSFSEEQPSAATSF